MPRLRLIGLVAIVALASGCGRFAESRFNPFNWFGGDEETEVREVEVATVRDPRPLVAEVSRISIEPAPGGAILRAVGLPATQGHYDGALIEAPTAPGALAFQFRLMPPPVATRVSTVRSREVVVALFLSDQTLQGVREIRVFGAGNGRAIRR